MHNISEFIADMFTPLAIVSNTIATALAGGHAPSFEMSLAGAFLVSAAVVGVAASLWAAWSHARFTGLRNTMRAEVARSRATLLLRDAIIEGGGDAIVVMGVDMSVPLAFGGGSSLLQACLSGPEAAGLASSLDRLLEAGVGFETVARVADQGKVIVRGHPIGRRAVLFLRRDTSENRNSDPRAALDCLPQPAWLRDRDGKLVWVNRAFLSATGAKTMDAALADGFALHKTERDLAHTVREFGGPVEARRYALSGEQRRAFTITLDSMGDGTIVGTAVDVTDAAQAEAKLKLQADANAEVLDRLDIGVAIFGADRRLARYNRAYLKQWGLPEEWLATRPEAGDVLDRLRELRKLPEQRDFNGWKQDRLAMFESDGRREQEYWHLPSGHSLLVSAQPDMLGGLTFLYEDVTDQLRLESSYTNMIRVQRATLDTLQEGMAVIGTDGRLKLHNSAFRKLWDFGADELMGEPHLTDLANSCEVRFGRDNTWAIVAAAVSSSDPASYNKWGAVDRSDGVTISLTLTRLPDGATLVSFSDETDVGRLDEMLKSDRHPAAA